MRKGFTLVEFAVVLGIVAVLAIIGYQTLSPVAAHQRYEQAHANDPIWMEIEETEEGHQWNIGGSIVLEVRNGQLFQKHLCNLGEADEELLATGEDDSILFAATALADAYSNRVDLTQPFQLSRGRLANKSVNLGKACSEGHLHNAGEFIACPFIAQAIEIAKAVELYQSNETEASETECMSSAELRANAVISRYCGYSLCGTAEVNDKLYEQASRGGS